MTDLSATPVTGGLKRRPLFGRIVRATLYVKLGLALVLGLATGIVYLRLSAGPFNMKGMSERVAAALADRIGPGWTVRLNDTAVELSGWVPALRASGIDIRNPDGILVFRAPYAIVSLDPLSLTSGTLALRSIELRDLRLRASIADDGALSFERPGDGAEAETVRPPTVTAAPTRPAALAEGGVEPSKLSVAVASLFDLAFEPTSIVAALDKARISDASLTLIGSDRRERVAFSSVNASFERIGDKQRSFALELEGSRGTWHLAGNVGMASGGTRMGDVSIRDVPVHDLLLLSGLSRLPAAADLKVSGEVSAHIARGRLETLKGSLRTSKGVVTVEDPDTPPIRVDALSADADWDEDHRALALHGLTFQGGETQLRLEGRLAPIVGQEGWGLSLAGGDIVVSGAGDQDRPFPIAKAEADLRFADGGVLLDHLALTGEGIGLTVSGSYGTNAEQGGLRAAVDVRKTDARRLLRLWPDAMAADVRRYLIANTRDGNVEKLALSAAVSAADVREGLRGQPLPDKSFEVEFSLDRTALLPAAGLPVLQNGRAAGVATGRTVSVRVASAQVEQGGRTLNLSSGYLRMKDTPNGEAQMGFWLDGSADALATVMQAPMIRKAAALDLDPSLIKGKVELKVDFPISFKSPTEMADVPVVAKGTLSDLVIDKAFGRDRLEAAGLALLYDRNGMSLKGDVRLSGLPANLELKQPKAGPGEASVTLVLDEAARLKRGLALAGQVTGPVAVKAVVALPKVERAGTVVDVDFTRATIDNLIPGWSKAAGKPGHASFVLHEGESGTEVSDLVVDSAPVLIKGAMSFGENGAEKGDFSTFKLSPGDEIRVQSERSGGVVRIQARGNVLDGRPFLRQLTTGAGGSKTQPRGEAVDIDLDLSANILAGFNDEALTGASVKLSLRNRELRQLQLQGRFRAAQVSAQMTQRERSSPVVTLRSADAGATLRFIDLYRRMVGGSLVLQSTLDGGVQSGGLEIESFELRNEPALKSIISQQPMATGGEERGGAQLSRLDIDEVHFSQLRSEFTRSTSRVDIKDAVIWGPQVGFKLGGFVDYARDRADISGTFVPAYGLNNVFSQVPVFGMILGGGQNEGLFAINFRIHGAPSAPTLVVNPLSAVAPGIFRKLFGTGGPGDTTGTTAPIAPDRR